MNQNREKVFFVSYYFFPGWGVGSIRTIKFCKYLKRLGFDPVVFTTAGRKDGKKDYSLADDVRGIEVVRAPQLTRFESNFLLNLDWVMLSLVKILFHSLRSRPRVIIYTGSPYGPFLIAPLVRLFRRIPYLLDFRDPWVPIREGGGWKETPGNHLRGLIERISLRFAAGAIFVNQRNLDLYRDYYGGEIGRKSFVIENGFDREDAGKIGGGRLLPEGKYNIVYPGKLYSENRSNASEILLARIENFLQALGKVPEPGGTRPVMFHLAGKPEPSFIKLVEKYRLGDRVKMWGEMGFYESLRLIRDSDLCLIFGTGQGWVSSTKIYEYLAFGRPVLALVESDSYIGELIARAGAGKSVPGLAVAEIEESLRFFREAGGGGYRGAEKPREYDRENQAGELAEVINQVAG